MSNYSSAGESHTRLCNHARTHRILERREGYGAAIEGQLSERLLAPILVPSPLTGPLGRRQVGSILFQALTTHLGLLERSQWISIVTSYRRYQIYREKVEILGT